MGDPRNITVKRGDTTPLPLTFTDENGSAVDITGWTIYFTVKAKIDDEDNDAKIKKDVTTHSDPTNGKTVITLSSSDTSIDPGNYYYDVQVKTNTGEIYTPLEGNFIVRPDITKRV